MEMILTVVAFFALTLFLVRRHLRAAGGTGAAPPAPALPARPCPRCRTAVPAGSAFCPACGVPQQVFEVVAAREVAEAREAGAGPAAGALHAVVRADVCVGCGTCVAACPEPGAIRLQGKLAVVETALCQGHGKCVEACPVGGIVLSSGAAVHRVEVPALSGCFESSVPGLYIVGELGGRGLIKNAINEGKIAAEAIAAELRAERAARDRCAPPSDPGLLDLIVVGSGPAGLSAGLEAMRQHLSCAVLERGTLADSIRKYPRHKLLFAEPLSIPLYGDLWISDASKETLLEVWQTIISNTGLDVRVQHEVRNVRRDDGRFVVETAAGPLRARRVVLAMGRRGTPRRLEVPGEELGKVFYDIVEMEAFQGSRVLVVGGGDSAIESAVGLANQPGTAVTLSYRGAQFERAKERNRAKLDDAVAHGRLRLVLESRVRAIREDAVELEHGGTCHRLPNDYVILRLGGEPPFAFLERLGVRIVKKDLPLAGSSEAAVA